MEMKERIALVQDSVIAHRRWLHVHPELSGQEKETAAYITGALRKLGLEPIENVGGYGVVAVIKGRAGGKCVCASPARSSLCPSLLSPRCSPPSF